METWRKLFATLNFGLLLAIAFLLPFGQFVASIEGTLFIAWCLQWNWREKWTNWKSSQRLLWPWLFFIALYFAGMLWTSNTDEGWRNIQVKLSLLIFPLILASMRLSTRQTQWMLALFVKGLIACGLFMLVRSTFDYYRDGTNTFFYQDFSRELMHPSYLSMYYCAAIMLLFHGILLQSFSMKQKIAAIAICLFFAVIVFLLSSKMGILMMILLFGGYIVYAIFRFKRYVVGIASFVVLVGGFFIAVNVFPTVHARLERMKEILFVSQEVDPSAVESNQVRTLIWQADYALVSRHPWSGVGTGDGRDSLLAEYQKRGMTGAYEKKLNAHSQLFQTAIILGIAGLATLLLLVLGPAVWAIRNQFGFAALFAGLFLINMLPESMFELQAGTLFFGFFYSLILFAIDKRCLSPLKAPTIQFTKPKL